jgi:hypothetical protein
MRLLALVLSLFAALPVAAQTLSLAEDPPWADIAPIPEGTPHLRAEVEGG